MSREVAQKPFVRGYLAKPGTNRGFILMHSTGSLPNGSEIDTPLNYADYYYLEALLRYMQVKEIDISIFKFIITIS